MVEPLVDAGSFISFMRRCSTGFVRRYRYQSVADQRNARQFGV